MAMNYDQFLEEIGKLPSKGWVAYIVKSVNGVDVPDKNGSISLRLPYYTKNQGHGPLDALATDLSGKTHSSWYPYEAQRTLAFDDCRININHLIWAEMSSKSEPMKYRGGQITQEQIRRDLIIALRLENYPTEEDISAFEQFARPIKSTRRLTKLFHLFNKSA